MTSGLLEGVSLQGGKRGCLSRQPLGSSKMPESGGDLDFQAMRQRVVLLQRCLCMFALPCAFRGLIPSCIWPPGGRIPEGGEARVPLTTAVGALENARIRWGLRFSGYEAKSCPLATVFVHVCLALYVPRANPQWHLASWRA